MSVARSRLYFLTWRNERNCWQREKTKGGNDRGTVRRWTTLTYQDWAFYGSCHLKRTRIPRLSHTHSMRVTSPRVQSSMMIHTGFSVITPISLTMWGWSNWRIVTARKKDSNSIIMHLMLMWCETHWQTHKIASYVLLAGTFLWRCQRYSSYRS